VVPEAYELTLRHGSVLDQRDVDEFIADVAKTQKLTADEAQSAFAAYEQSLLDQSAKLQAQLVADAEIGGANLANTQRDVKRLIDRYVPETTPEGLELRAFLHKSGLGNAAPLVRLLARAGKEMAEDRPIPADMPRGSITPNMVELFYGKPQA
jgi:hypothetical protein